MKTLRYCLAMMSCFLLIACSKSEIPDEQLPQSAAKDIEHVISLAEKSRAAEVFTNIYAD